MLTFKSVHPRGAFAFGMDVPKLRLDYQGLVILEGPNGSGKSSLMNSIVQAAFGKNDTPGVGDEIANVVLKEGCDIALDVEIDREPWTIELARGFKRPGSQAKVTDLFLFDRDGQDRREESMPATYARVRQLFGMDFEQFRARSYLGVQTASKFLDGTDADRMKIITPFLGLDVWDRTQERVRLLKNEAAAELTKTRARYDYIKEQLESCMLSVLTDEERASLQASMDKAAQDVKATLSEIDRIRASTTSLDNRIRVLESDLIRFNNDAVQARNGSARALQDKEAELRTAATSTPEVDRTNLDKLRTDKREFEIRVRDRKSKYTSDLQAWKTAKVARGVDCKIDAQFTKAEDAVAEVSHLRGRLASAQDAFSRASSQEEGECPTCFSQVTKDHLIHVQAQYEQMAQDLQSKIDAAMARSNDAYEKARALFEKVRESNIAALESANVEATQSEEVALQSLTSGVATEEAEIAAVVANWRAARKATIEANFTKRSKEFADQLKKADEAAKATRLEIDKLKLDPATLKNRTRVAELQKEIQDLNKVVDEARVALANDVLRTKQVADLQKDSGSSRIQVAELETRVADLEFLDAHTGDKGIKRYKLRDCLGFMNKRLSEYMELMGLSLQVWFQDRVLKKSAMKKKRALLTDDDFIDKFEILVTDGLKVGVPLGLYSGGERVLVMLSLLGVLWETGNATGRGGSNLLMIDEPFGLLREENRDRAVQLLEYWGSLGKCVIVSDNTGSTDSVSRRAATWRVRKEDHVSTVEVVE